MWQRELLMWSGGEEEAEGVSSIPRLKVSRPVGG